MKSFVRTVTSLSAKYMTSLHDCHRPTAAIAKFGRTSPKYIITLLFTHSGALTIKSTSIKLFCKYFKTDRTAAKTERCFYSNPSDFTLE